MRFSKNGKYLLFSLLILLNILIRIPSVPYTSGDPDSYPLLAMADSLSKFGHANWWLHPLSIFGFYPYSYASSTMFLFSGFSQFIGLDKLLTLQFYSIIIGLLSIFTAYLMARAITNDDVFKFLVAFTFSLSPGILVYTTNMVMARALLMILVPLFIYLLLKSHTSLMRYGSLILILFFLLIATHHLFYFTIPIIFSYFLIKICYSLPKLGRYTKIFRTYQLLVIFSGFLFMFSIPFLTGSFMMTSSRYDLNLTDFPRYIGPLVIFSISGIIYLIFKREKGFEKWLILSSLIFTTVFIYEKIYIKWYYPLYGSLLASMSLENLAKIKKLKKIPIYVLIIVLIGSASFSGFYQHWRTGLTTGDNPFKWYTEETTYFGAQWARENIKNGRLIISDWHTARNILGNSGVPTFIGDSDEILTTFGFASKDDIKLKKISPTNEQFYLTSPYMDVSPQPIESYSNRLLVYEVDSQFGEYVINRFNLSHAIEKNDILDIFERRGRIRETIFFRSLPDKKDNIYDNGKIQVWNLD